MLRNLVISSLFFLAGHLMVWFQINGQFIWKGWRDNLFLVSLLGIPISLFFIWATKWGVAAFDGLFWPTRFFGFSIGVIIYGIMVSYFFNEDISAKTFITLSLAFVILLVQVFWK
tara:strand:+ start:399 stop:743 length:345 start_codon:yes stop_codon:yes gene_type:complete